MFAHLLDKHIRFADSFTCIQDYKIQRDIKILFRERDPNFRPLRDNNL